MNDTIYDRLLILNEDLIYFDRTLEGLDDVLFSLVDAKLATEDAEILKQLNVLDQLIKEYDQTLLNFPEIQDVLYTLLERVKLAA